MNFIDFYKFEHSIFEGELLLPYKIEYLPLYRSL